MSVQPRTGQEGRALWRDYILERHQGRCQLCRTAAASEVHEIERRSHAAKTWANVVNYLHLCQDCHHQVIPIMDHAEQLAVKLVTDPEHFALVEWLKLRDPGLRAPERVTMADIANYLEVTDYGKGNSATW
ncbi:hypothetical protein K0U83_21405 [bacterium]|nr:hypothetical protein [bacterium]